MSSKACPASGTYPPSCKSSAEAGSDCVKNVLEDGMQLELLEPSGDLVEWHYCNQPVAQAPLHETRIDQDHVADSAIAPLCGLLDNLIGCSGEPDFPHHRRWDLSRMGQG